MAHNKDRQLSEKTRSHHAGSVTNSTLGIIKEALTLFEIWPSAKNRNPAGRTDTNMNYDQEWVGQRVVHVRKRTVHKQFK